jgi:hypothetical protein
LSVWVLSQAATSASTACPNSVLAPLHKTWVSGSEMPISTEIHGRAALHRQSRNRMNLIAIADPAMVFAP